LETTIVRRLPILFADWTARTRTSETMTAALRALMQGAPPAVRAHLAINDACDFGLEAMTLAVSKAAD
jgi:hypothetical protein